MHTRTRARTPDCLRLASLFLDLVLKGVSTISKDKLFLCMNETGIVLIFSSECLLL
jgi:hypothetical protein